MKKISLFSKGQATQVLLWKSHYAACSSTVRIKDFERKRKAACRLLINTVKQFKSKQCKLIKAKIYTGFRKIQTHLNLKLPQKDFSKYCPKLYSNKIWNWSAAKRKHQEDQFIWYKPLITADEGLGLLLLGLTSQHKLHSMKKRKPIKQKWDLGNFKQWLLLVRSWEGTDRREGRRVETVVLLLLTSSVYNK